MLLPGNSTTTMVSPLHATANPAGEASFSADRDELLFIPGLPAAEVHRRAMAAQRLAGKAHHLLAQWLVEMDERKLSTVFGCSSVFMYAELNLHLEGHTVAEYLRTGRTLKDFPLLAEAYGSGRLSSSKLREITRVVSKETEEYWLKIALTHTTRQIEKMVVFSPRPSRPGNVSASEEHPVNPGTLHSSSAGQVADPTTGLTAPQPSPASHRDCPMGESPSANPSSTPSNRSREESIERRTTHKATDTPASVCCKETTAAHQAHHSDETIEVQVLTDRVSPEKYHEKMLIELSGEQAAVIRDALQKARKESGFSDRASLFTYMARTFLEGGQEPGTSSKKPSYQVVIHHHPGAGVTWTETDKGSVYVPDATFARVMCDAEIVELPAAPLDFAPREQAVEEEHKAMTAKVRRDDNTGEGHAHSDSDDYRKSESPLDGVNRLYEIYRERARSEKRDKSEKKTRKNPTGTIPPSLRKKVLLRDERRCQVPGCGRSHFVEVHHLMPQGACGAHVPEHLLVVCQFCHNLVHEGRLIIEGKAPGRLVFRRV